MLLLPPVRIAEPERWHARLVQSCRNVQTIQPRYLNGRGREPFASAVALKKIVYAEKGAVHAPALYAEMRRTRHDPETVVA